MAKTFGAEDILSVLGLSSSDFEVIDSDNDFQQDSAAVRNNIGAWIPGSEKVFNGRNEKTLTLQANDPDGATIAFTLGGIGTTNVVITRAVARQEFNRHATIRFTAHIHDGANAHLAAPAEVDVTSVSLGFGVLAVQLGGTLADAQSSEIIWMMDHRDRQGNQGQFLVGASYGLRIDCVEEYVDDGSTITVPSGWTQDGQRKSTRQDDFYTRIVRAHRFDAIS